MIEQYVYDEFCEYLDISLELTQNAFILLKDVGKVDHDSAIEHIEKQMSLRAQI